MSTNTTSGKRSKKRANNQRREEKPDTEYKPTFDPRCFPKLRDIWPTEVGK